MTIPPASFVPVITLLYYPGRSYKIKNKGAEPLNWGLSVDENAFTNEAHIVNASSTSTKQSSTLGPVGNILLVQNTGLTAADIELTVIE